ncbi:MAG: MFS transporter [Gammaproteobacteria bacterium]
MLIAATIGCGTGASSLLYYSFGVFVEPLQRHFHWTRGEVTSALFYGSFGLVLAAPGLGWMIDRFGTRVVALVAIPCFSAIVVTFSRFNGNLLAFYAMFFIAAVLGSGTTPILYTRAVAGHFDAARGLALGITLAGPGSAAILLPPFMTATISTHGWQHGFAVLAALAIAPWLLVYWWLDQEPRVAWPVVLTGMTRRQALRTRAFWTIVIGFGAVSVACSALLVHFVPMLRDAGLGAPRAARIASLIGVGVILGRVGIGWVIDRVFAPTVAAVIFLVTATGCALLAISGVAQAPLAAFLIGFALGAEVDLLAFLTSRYFGLRYYGILYATVYAAFWIGIACGPALAGRLYDRYQNYEIALWWIVALLGFGAVAAMTLPRFDQVHRS